MVLIRSTFARCIGMGAKKTSVPSRKTEVLSSENSDPLSAIIVLNSFAKLVS